MLIGRDGGEESVINEPNLYPLCLVSIVNNSNKNDRTVLYRQIVVPSKYLEGGNSLS
jgi:hypothetical protein